ncbi:MAG: Small subunit (SSU) processome component [Pycnora praestabilis]|nr:MAG: Small subunit (SSU) processome component [Pycnora praestabilis]
MHSSAGDKKRPLQRLQSLKKGNQTPQIEGPAVHNPKAETNGVKSSRGSNLDESRTEVVQGGDASGHLVNGGREIVEISSGGDEESDIDSSDPSEGDNGDNVSIPTSGKDVQMIEERSPEEAAADISQAEEPEEPSFGEMVQANATYPIDVEASFVNTLGDSQSLLPSNPSRVLPTPSATSLGTVLTQSLKTNDINLLESCLHVTDLRTIRSTIERLNSSLAGSLLQKLAERLHRRPGRAGSLMVWVQWTLVSHGGYLAGQPELMKKLSSLHRVIKDRANGLQPLLSLKGKLDMLEAQMQLRKSMQASAQSTNFDDEDDEEGVIYVEGEEEEDSEEEPDRLALENHNNFPQKRAGKSGHLEDYESDARNGSGDDDDAMPTTAHGVVADSEDEAGSDDEDEDVIDDEADETDDDSSGGSSMDDVDHDDVDPVEDDQESDDGAPPPKRPARTRQSGSLYSKQR